MEGANIENPILYMKGEIETDLQLVLLCPVTSGEHTELISQADAFTHILRRDKVKGHFDARLLNRILSRNIRHAGHEPWYTHEHCKRKLGYVFSSTF